MPRLLRRQTSPDGAREPTFAISGSNPLAEFLSLCQNVTVRRVPVAEFKRRFSELVAEVRYRGERVVVTRHDTPVAALVGLDDLRQLSLDRPADQRRRLGLLGAIGAWADYEDLDQLVRDIYAARESAVDRPVEFPDTK